MSRQPHATVRRTGLIRRLEMCITNLEEENQILRKSLEESDQMHKVEKEKLKAANISLFGSAQNLYIALGAEAYEGDTLLHRAWAALGDALKKVESMGEGK